MKWRTITPGQSAVLCLLREYGPATFQDGFRRLAWWRDDGALFLTGPSIIGDALAARGLAEISADTWRITPDGRSAVQSIRSMPAVARRAERMLQPMMLTDEQMARVAVWFPRSHGVQRRDDRAVLSGIVDVLRRNLLWGEAHPAYGGEMALRRRFKNWGQSGVLDNVLGNLFETVEGTTRLVVIGEDLARHASARFGAARGWFPTLLDAAELGA